MKNQTYRMTMLFDFYGELLTERQKEFFDLYYNEDLSLSEISEILEISRQGVMDIIRRGEAQLNQLEHGLKLSALYSEISSVTSELEKVISDIDDNNLREKLRNILNKLQ